MGKYYTPSGRCIQSKTYAAGEKAGSGSVATKFNDADRKVRLGGPASRHGSWNPRIASERRGVTLKRFKGVYLEAKAGIWP